VQNIFCMEVFWGLATIVFIDLVLAGDNALVIGMAARNLPAKHQKKVIIWGTIGAILIRALSTFIVVWLLKIPVFMITGGVLLIWIAYSLIIDEKAHDIDAPSNFMAAVRTIIIADGIMGIDNVIAVAGIANGNWPLIGVGILITIPIIIWCSTAFIQIVERYPIVIYLGGGILTWTAGGMITGDPLISSNFTLSQEIKWLVNICIVIITLYLARAQKNSNAR